MSDRQPAAPPTVGPYRLQRRLGVGAFGMVALAEDPRTGARVAVKLHPAGGRALARLHREYLLLQRLDHPAVPVPAELGSLGAEGGWFAMSLATGQTPIEHVRRAGPPGSAARARATGDLLVDLLAAVDVLHRRGVVHCDLKASNLLVDDDGHVTLLDLGGVEVLGPDGAPVDGLGSVSTRTSAALEQHVGAPVDARADLHALGVLGWRLLVDERPFPDDGDAVTRLVDARPVAPHDRCPDVPPALSDLVMSLLALAPADRPASADAARATLEALGHAGVGWPTPEPRTFREDDGPDPLARRAAALVDRAALTSAGDLLRGAGDSVAVALQRARVDVALGRLRPAVHALRALLASSAAVDAACLLGRAAEALGDPAVALDPLDDVARDADRVGRARTLAARARLLAELGATDAAEDAAVAATAGLVAPDPAVRAEIGAALARVAPALAPGPEPWLATPAARLHRLDRHVVTLRAALASGDVDAAADALAGARRLAGWIATGLSADDRATLGLHLATLGVW